MSRKFNKKTMGNIIQNLSRRLEIDPHVSDMVKEAFLLIQPDLQSMSKSTFTYLLTEAFKIDSTMTDDAIIQHVISIVNSKAHWQPWQLRLLYVSLYLMQGNWSEETIKWAKYFYAYIGTMHEHDSMNFSPTYLQAISWNMPSVPTEREQSVYITIIEDFVDVFNKENQ